MCILLTGETKPKEEVTNMDWGSSAMDWGAPVSTIKNDDLVLSWDEDDDKG